MVLFVHKINLFPKRTSHSSYAHTHTHAHQRAGNILLYFMCIYTLQQFSCVVVVVVVVCQRRVCQASDDRTASFDEIILFYMKCGRTNSDDHQFRRRANSNSNNNNNNNGIRPENGSPTRVCYTILLCRTHSGTSMILTYWLWVRLDWTALLFRFTKVFDFLRFDCLFVGVYDVLSCLPVVTIIIIKTQMCVAAETRLQRTPRLDILWF